MNQWGQGAGFGPGPEFGPKDFAGQLFTITIKMKSSIDPR